MFVMLDGDFGLCSSNPPNEIPLVETLKQVICGPRFLGVRASAASL
jgi:hypothetical protein